MVARSELSYKASDPGGVEVGEEADFFEPFGFDVDEEGGADAEVWRAGVLHAGEDDGEPEGFFGGSGFCLIGIDPGFGFFLFPNDVLLIFD